MIAREELRGIVILSYLTDPMLDKLAEIVDVLRFDKGEIIFREKEPSVRFYMLKSGRVLLEQQISNLESDVRRVEDKTEFDRRLKAGTED